MLAGWAGSYRALIFVAAAASLQLVSRAEAAPTTYYFEAVYHSADADGTVSGYFITDPDAPPLYTSGPQADGSKGGSFQIDGRWQSTGTFAYPLSVYSGASGADEFLQDSSPSSSETYITLHYDDPGSDAPLLELAFLPGTFADAWVAGVPIGTYTSANGLAGQLWVHTPVDELIPLQSLTVTTSVPEPGTLGIMLAGLAGSAAIRRRRSGAAIRHL